MCFSTVAPHPAPATNIVSGTALSRGRGAFLLYIIVNTVKFPPLFGRGVPEGRGEVLFGMIAASGMAEAGPPVSSVFGLEAKFSAPYCFH